MTATQPPNLVLVPGTPQARIADGRTTIAHVVGARPNFVKMAPVIAALERREAFHQVIVHTGQHYDSRMSDEVLADLDFPDVDVFLGVGSGTHGVQTAKVLSAFETVLLDIRPDVVLVAGDVNSTLACALAASKLGIAVAHLEAACARSTGACRRRSTGCSRTGLADTLFTHSPRRPTTCRPRASAPGSVHYVGNTMIDSLRRCEKRARAMKAWEKVDVPERSYVLVTLHRPSNVDDPAAPVGDRRGPREPVRAPLRSCSRSTRARVPGWPRTVRSAASRAPAWRASSRWPTSSSCRCRPARARS